ncbi:hypothetical protein HW555_004197 [Spodoptera exigua]|uniref:Uncharacterized protein n=1 Tax=Spodoptera exigua TaxID=7107 RepID=A0A835GIW3_SPOEX|nr:hypothetical protein HW555_004197 [Spodoptera exigua]
MQITGIIAVVNCLEPLADNNIDEETKTILDKYVKLIPDIKSRYVIDDSLSKIIDYYFKDRNPVKIPWSADQAGEVHNENEIQKALNEQLDKKTKGKHYKVKMISKLSMRNKKSNNRKAIGDGSAIYTVNHVIWHCYVRRNRIKQHILSNGIKFITRHDASTLYDPNLYSFIKYVLHTSTHTTIHSSFTTKYRRRDFLLIRVPSTMLVLAKKCPNMRGKIASLITAQKN